MSTDKRQSNHDAFGWRKWERYTDLGVLHVSEGELLSFLAQYTPEEIYDAISGQTANYNASIFPAIFRGRPDVLIYFRERDARPTVLAIFDTDAVGYILDYGVRHSLATEKTAEMLYSLGICIDLSRLPETIRRELTEIVDYHIKFDDPWHPMMQEE